MAQRTYDECGLGVKVLSGHGDLHNARRSAMQSVDPHFTQLLEDILLAPYQTAGLRSEIDDAGKPLADDLQPCTRCHHVLADHDEAGFCEAGTCNCQRFRADLDGDL